MERSLRIRKLEDIPSPEEFATQIESKNVPAVFSGCVKEWKAFHKWNPHNGGLSYLEELVGPAVVEAMLSRAAPVFYGDIRRHERVPIPFKDFIDSCKQILKHEESEVAACSELKRKESSEDSTGILVDSRDQIYLAQVPLMNKEGDGRVQLAPLHGDIQMPGFLRMKDISTINIWMNSSLSRSSTHYDPHHNLLCIVSGCKKVSLWPPSSSPLLYPMPIYGEASNHSSVALETPDYLAHPRAERLLEYAEKVTLQAGDALFIPEGWYHQVDSDELTIGINFWWNSLVVSSMPEHMDVYYLRMILRRYHHIYHFRMPKVKEEITATHKDKALPRRGFNNMTSTSCTNKSYINGNSENQVDDFKGTKLTAEAALIDSDPITKDAIHKIVSLVHDRVSITDQSQIKVAVNTIFLEEDSVAKILWGLDSLHLQSVIISMARDFPRTLEALILHLLTPVGAEVLTRKFDEMDLQNSEEERNDFYQAFYGVFDDVNAAMDGILTMKESFARQAFSNVFDLYLGVSIDDSKPVVG